MPPLPARFRSSLGVAAVIVGLAGASWTVPEVAPRAGATEWAWPVTHVVIVRPYVQPAHDYAPGHRGIDLRPGDDVVRSPAAGVVAFRGRVVDRDLITIAHAGGYVTTLEPVDSHLQPGTPVERGAVVGTLGVGGGHPAGVLHFGVRLEGRYVNPLGLLGGVPRAVLLPCCEQLGSTSTSGPVADPASNPLANAVANAVAGDQPTTIVLF